MLPDDDYEAGYALQLGPPDPPPGTTPRGGGEVRKRLRDRRLNTWNECRKLAYDAAGEDREFTPAELGRFDVLQEEIETLDRRIRAVLDTERRAAERAGKPPPDEIPEVVRALRDWRAAVWQRALRIAEDATGENRTLTDAELGLYDACQEELEHTDRRIRGMLDAGRRAREADAAYDALRGPVPKVCKMIRDHRLNVWTDLVAMVTGATAGRRSMIPEEQGRYEAMLDELELLDERAMSGLRTARIAEEADEAFDELNRARIARIAPQDPAVTPRNGKKGKKAKPKTADRNGITAR